MARKSGGWEAPVYGRSVLPGSASITAEAAVFQAIGVQVSLPKAGRYRLDMTARGKVATTAGDGWLSARLFNVTSNTAVANSEVITAFSREAKLMDAQGATSLFLAVNEPTVIRMEAARHGAAWSQSDLISNVHGRTALSFHCMG